MCRNVKQRERTGRLTLDDVKKYFHLPIEKAARRMDVCPTVLKKICRRGGLPRWPYRKVSNRKHSTRKDPFSFWFSLTYWSVEFDLLDKEPREEDCSIEGGNTQGRGSPSKGGSGRGDREAIWRNQADLWRSYAKLEGLVVVDFKKKTIGIFILFSDIICRLFGMKKLCLSFGLNWLFV